MTRAEFKRQQREEITHMLSIRQKMRESKGGGSIDIRQVYKVDIGVGLQILRRARARIVQEI